MGIKCKESIVIKTQDEFHAVDKIATGFAFDIQNTLGRFCDEKIYKKVMALKCNETSIRAQKAMRIT